MRENADNLRTTFYQHTQAFITYIMVGKNEYTGFSHRFPL